MNIQPSDLKTFICFSTLVTGFSDFQLKGTGMTELYYKTVTSVVGETVMSELLEAFDNIASDESSLEKQLRVKILSDEKLGPVARNIIKLWYIGTWYQLPAAWRQRFGANEADRDFIPDPNAYVEGLLWPAIGAHPPGAKAPGYGTWTEAPVIPTASAED